jgi:hypothetical protein
MVAQPLKYGCANRVKNIYQKGSGVKMAKKSVDLSRRVVAAIESYKGTLRGFSRESGIPYGSLFAYASGKKKPGLDALAAIVKVSEVSPVWLLSGEGDMHQHAESTKALHVDGRLLASIATEIEMALIRVGELNREARKAALEGLPLNEKQYYALIAKELGISPSEVKQRTGRIGYKTVLTATIYNLVADLPDDEKRSHRIREQAYELLTYTGERSYVSPLEPAQDQTKANPKRQPRRK